MGSSMGSSAMSSSTTAMGAGMGAGMSPSAAAMTPTTAVTNAAGDASYSLRRPDGGSYCGLRVVVTQPGSATRVAGGIAGELLTLS